jgi:hypothetical protein
VHASLTEGTAAACRLIRLTSRMFGTHDDEEILKLAAESVAAVCAGRAEAGYLVRGTALVPVGPRNGRQIDAQIYALQGADGIILWPGRAWCRAFPLWHAESHRGYLVVTAAAEPAEPEIRGLILLAGQTALALETAFAHRRDRDRIRSLREESATVNDRLKTVKSDLERERLIHQNLGGASHTGEPGIARAMHAVTGLPVAIEDKFGNLRAWAGPGRPDAYPKQKPQQRNELLRELTRRGSVVRVRDRLIALAHTRDDMLGVLILIDPRRTAGRHEVLALEHGALVLAGELAHQHDLAELQRRLCGDLVADLINGTDDETAYARSRAIDHDLQAPHRVVVIRWAGGEAGLARAAAHAAAGLGIASLVSTRDGMTVLLASGRPDGQELHDALARRLLTTAGSIGIGGRSDSPDRFPRSYQEALLALNVRLASRSPHGATSFDELGVIRVLDTDDGGTKIRRFVRDWLGRLLDYDARNHSELVRTLAEHLDCGGSYDETAQVLVIHRSTLRYRLQRIREVSGLDITAADNRLHLHVATRAWRILDGTT